MGIQARRLSRDTKMQRTWNAAPPQHHLGGNPLLKTDCPEGHLARHLPNRPADRSRSFGFLRVAAGLLETCGGDGRGARFAKMCSNPAEREQNQCQSRKSQAGRSLKQQGAPGATHTQKRSYLASDHHPPLETTSVHVDVYTAPLMYENISLGTHKHKWCWTRLAPSR